MNDLTNIKTSTKDGAKTKKTANENAESFKLPTLDQFMELVTAEQTTLTATPSGYNVYNKYHKSS